MRILSVLTVFFGVAAYELLAQPGINNASVNGILNPPVSTQIYPNQATSISGVFQNQGGGLAYAFFTFETWPSPNYSCKVGVQVGNPTSTSYVYLHDDNGNLMNWMMPGSSQQDDNSKCTLYSNGSYVTISPDGSQYTVTVNVVFKDPFNGPKYIWMDGYDTRNGQLVSSGWYCPNAAFTVQSQDYAPQTVSVSPSSGSNQPGQTQQFAYTTSDPNGAYTLYHSELVFGRGSTWLPGYAFFPGGPGQHPLTDTRCKIIQDSNYVSLENDQQNGYVDTIAMGPNVLNTHPISNSQCTVYPVSSGGNATSLQSQTITFTVSFTSAFSGQLQDHIFAADNLGLSTWDTQADGTWNWTVIEPDPFASPDSQPLTYPNYLTDPGTQNAACNITGTWNDSAISAGSNISNVVSGFWNLTQTDNALSGNLTINSSKCGSVAFSVTGTFGNNIAQLSASGPNPPVDSCSVPGGTDSATFTLASCSNGAVSETVTRPSFVNQFGQIVPGGTASGTGTITLTGAPTRFTVSPSPNLFLSTGDQNVAIKTTSSNSSYAMSNIIYSPSLFGNPNSDCLVTLAIAPGSGTGVASSTVRAAPAGCSGIFNTYANVGGTTTTNLTKIVVPPQILLQVMYGEAHSQAARFGIGDITEQALGIVIRNRFGSPYFKGATTYQNSIYLQQFNGINYSLTTGTDAQGNPSAELLNAGAVFGGSSTVSVANAKCFFSPTLTDWQRIQAALNSGTTVLPVAAFDPGCFYGHQQFVYKQSISMNADGRGAPSFIFSQWRNPTDPAVIQIP